MLRLRAIEPLNASADSRTAAALLYSKLPICSNKEKVIQEIGGANLLDTIERWRYLNSITTRWGAFYDN